MSELHICEQRQNDFRCVMTLNGMYKRKNRLVYQEKVLWTSLFMSLPVEVNTLKTCLTEKEDSWKMKLEKEEEESLKREQALINGYKAEIANLKNQVIKTVHHYVQVK